jgi:thioester reductase-like protein
MQHILVTGTTGLIGGIVAAQLLTRKDTFLILPVRARTEAEAYLRLARSLKRFTPHSAPRTVTPQLNGSI